MGKIYCICHYCSLIHTIKMLFLDTSINIAARPGNKSSESLAGLFKEHTTPLKAMEVFPGLPRGSLLYPSSTGLTPHYCPQPTHGHFQGRKDHIVLNMQVGIDLIPWVQNNVNGTIIMHMLPPMSPIKSKGYCYLALSVADVCMIDYWGCNLQCRTLFIPNLLSCLLLLLYRGCFTLKVSAH